MSSVDEMEKRGVQPNVVTYNTLMDAICKEREVGKALDLMNLMSEKGSSPSAITYTTLMSGFLQQSKISDVENISKALVDNALSLMLSAIPC